MNAHDARFVCDYLQASFPRQLEAAQVLVWAEELGGYGRDEAIAAIRRLRAERTFLPSHAEFRQAVGGLRARAEARAELPAGPLADTPPDLAAERLAALRAQVARVGRPRPPAGPVPGQAPPPPAPGPMPEASPRLPPCREGDHRYCGRGPVVPPAERQRRYDEAAAKAEAREARKAPRT